MTYLQFFNLFGEKYEHHNCVQKGYLHLIILY